MVVAGDAVAQRRQPLIYPLYNDLIGKAIADMKKLCMYN